MVGLSADENDRIELTAIVDGSPLPNAVWFRNGQCMESSPPDVMITNVDNKYSLVIDGVKVFQSEFIRCIELISKSFRNPRPIASKFLMSLAELKAPQK